MGENKPAIVYALYTVGWIVLAISIIGALAAASAFATTVEGPSTAGLIQAAAGAISGMLLLAVATVIDLLHRIAATAEVIGQGQRDHLHLARSAPAARSHPGLSTKSISEEPKSGI
jgi:uncharacterized membrane protein